MAGRTSALDHSHTQDPLLQCEVPSISTSSVGRPSARSVALTAKTRGRLVLGRLPRGAFRRSGSRFPGCALSVSPAPAATSCPLSVAASDGTLRQRASPRRCPLVYPTSPDNQAAPMRIHPVNVASDCDLLRFDFPRILAVQAPRPAFLGEFEVVRPLGDRGDVASVS